MRHPEITDSDRQLFALIHKHRGLTIAQVTEARLFPSAAYTYKRIDLLTERGFIDSREIVGMADWAKQINTSLVKVKARGKYLMLLTPGLESLAETDPKNWPDERLHLEKGRWTEWRREKNDPRLRILTAKLGLFVESASRFRWGGKYEAIGWGKQENNHSRLSGMITKRDGKKYAVFVIEPMASASEISSARQQSHAWGLINAGSYVFFCDKASLKKWGKPDYKEIVVLFNDYPYILFDDDGDDDDRQNKKWWKTLQSISDQYWSENEKQYKAIEKHRRKFALD